MSAHPSDTKTISENKAGKLKGDVKKYPAYFKDVSNIDEIDVYQVHQIFEVKDFSGCKHHASKKILLAGVRTGGKEEYKDMLEARDTINRWLQINFYKKEPVEFTVEFLKATKEV